MPRCKHCQTKFEPKTFLQKYCLNGDECMTAFRASTKIIYEKEVKARHKEIKIKNTNWKDVVQRDVQKIARLIDKGLPCLAIGLHAKMQGGHVWAKGHYTEMRFNLHNIHRQCAQSNTYRSDDSLMREKLSEEYGVDYGLFVDNLRNKEIPKISNEAFRAIHLVCLMVIDRLSTESATAQPNERILARNRVNEDLAIYDSARNVFIR